jgi:hypothetical protein
MPLNEITAAIATVKTATDIAKGILSLNKDVAVNEKAAELITVILSLQKDLLSINSEFGELLKSKSYLDEQLNKFNTWSKTESQYKLEEVSKGVFVRSPQNLQESKEPMHWLCTHCWEDQKKSILILAWQGESNAKYACPRCKNEIEVKSQGNYPRYPKRPDNFGGWKPGMG